jgi:hypothetical protein
MKKNKDMKNCLLILAFFVLNCCKTSINNVDRNSSKVNSNHANRFPGGEVITFDSLKINLNVQVSSLDSVIADVHFTNGTSDTLMLLKKILPSDSLTEGIFTLFKLNGNHLERIEPIPMKSYNKYAMGMQYFSPAVVPNPALDSFEVIKPGDRKKYSMNLVRFYDFKKINQRELYLNCHIYFPLIKNDKQVMVPSPHDSSLIVPVYFSVDCLPDTTVHINKHVFYKISLPY